MNYAPTNVRSFFSFDLPTIPIGCAVSKTTLDLHGAYSGIPRRPARWPSANLNLSLVRHPWTESGITWKNQPGANAWS